MSEYGRLYEEVSRIRAQLKELQRVSRLRLDNAMVVIAEGPTWKGNSSDMVQIRRGDLDELREALAAYRLALRGGIQ